MKYPCSMDINRIVRRRIQSDWSYRRGKKHGLLSPPRRGLFVVVPGTPSDFRTLRNFKRDLRRVRSLADCRNLG